MSLALAPVGSSLPISVGQALSRASAATGTDFGYLLATAKRESSLNPQAKSKSSSATGLFQFIDQTWLATLKKHGAKHGLAAQASDIEALPNGRFRVADSARRQEILALRKDPATAALMAGELTRDSAQTLQRVLGRAPDAGELYLAHFLGAGGAAKFLKAAEADPTAAASSLFPQAAHANPTVFRGDGGRALSLAEVKDRLTRMHEAGPQQSATRISAKVEGIDPVPAPATQTGPGQIPLAGPAAFGGAMQALRLTPQVLQILSSLDAVPGSAREADRGYGAALRGALG